MTPQELSMLENMLQRLAAVHGVQKDPQADALIRERLSTQPDALYLLVQRTLLLEHALDDARRQLAQRPPATPADPGGASFLQRGLEPGFGRDPVDRDAYTPGRPVRSETPATAPAPGWRERLFGASAPAAPAPTGGGSGGSFLGQAATAAAGVAGGMFLFNGIEHLIRGGHGGIGDGGNGGGFLGLGGNGIGNGGGGGTTEVIENVTQNFYGDDGSRSGGGSGGGGGNEDGGISRMADDAGADWSGFDDGGSFDDDRFA